MERLEMKENLGWKISGQMLEVGGGWVVERSAKEVKINYEWFSGSDVCNFVTKIRKKRLICEGGKAGRMELGINVVEEFGSWLGVCLKVMTVRFSLI
jgi:hypothetical protein